MVGEDGDSSENTERIQRKVEEAIDRLDKFLYRTQKLTGVTPREQYT